VDHAPTPQEKNYIVNAILAELESRDPTPNKQYTQWLAKVYIQDTWYIEDLNRNNWLGLYDLAKRRNMLRPEHRDINQFQSYGQFEDTMMEFYDPDEIDNQTTKIDQKGQAKEIYNGSTARIIIPEDQTAACYYGQGTRWCTAATRGKNYFDTYSDQGPLYIVIPKNPQYLSEKYQLHFPSYQFMNEEDRPVRLSYLLNERFPELLDEFKKIIPGLNDWVSFANDNLLENILDFVKKAILYFNGVDKYPVEQRKNKKIEQLNKILNAKNIRKLVAEIENNVDSAGPYRIIDIPDLLQEMYASNLLDNMGVPDFNIYGIGPDYIKNVRGDNVQKQYYVISFSDDDHVEKISLDANGNPASEDSIEKYINSVIFKKDMPNT
jgi:hypothetical protein